MSFRKPRYPAAPSAHFKTREDFLDYKKEYGSRFGERPKALLKSAKTSELDFVVTKRYWEVIGKSFWQPLKVWAFNKKALRYYGLVTALGLGFTYVKGIRPDLFQLAPRKHYEPPEDVRADFERLKLELGMEDRNIRLVISRDYSSNRFDRFTEPAVYGSPSLSRGATVCLPSVYFEELEGDEVPPVKVGETAFEWDTLNGVIVRRKLQLPRNELRFVMATSIVRANENMAIKECIKAPMMYLVGIFFYYSIIWGGLEHAKPPTFRVKLRRYEAAWTLLIGAYLLRMYYQERWFHSLECDEQVIALMPKLGASGANYMDRIAVIRNTIRNELGQYATRFITDLGDPMVWDWSFEALPDRSKLLARADHLRDMSAT